MVNSFVIMPGIGQVKKLNMNYILFPPRSGFVQQCNQQRRRTLRRSFLALQGSAPVIASVMLQSELRNRDVVTLRRYTEIPALLYMLRRKKITLLNPASWDDRNDAHYLSLYQQRKQLGSVLALCFTEVGETYHHWRVFAPGNSGICIRFHKQRLIDHLSNKTGIRVGPAQYKMMDHVRKKPISIDDLPFLKRYAFRDEREYRIIYESKRALASKDFSLPFECIDRITISPWVNDRLGEAIWETVRDIKGCGALTVGQSSLINNNEWKKLGGKSA
jgi:hypothetical protein